MRFRTLSIVVLTFWCTGLVATARAAVPIGIYSNIAGHPTSDVPGLPGLHFKSGTGTQFDRPFRSPDGMHWIFTALTDTGSSATEEVIIVGSGLTGTAVAQEGVTLMDGTRLCDSAGFDQVVSINNAGHYALSCSLDGATTDDEVIIRNVGAGFEVAHREGTDVAGIPGAKLGTALDSPTISGGGDISFRTSGMTGVPVGQTTALFVNGTANVVVQTGVTIPMPGTNTWQNVTANEYYVSSDAANWLANGDTDAATSGDGIIAVNNLIVVQEGQPVGALPGVATTTNREASLMSNGDWLARGSNDNGLDWLLRNGAVVAATDELVPGGLAGETFDDTLFSATFFSMIGNNNGDYVYGGTTSNADPNFDAVLVWNDLIVVARQGDPVDLDNDGMLDDDAFLHIFNNDDTFLTDDNVLHFFADLRNGEGDVIGQAYLQLQVPEPATLVLAALGLLSMSRRRRKAANAA